MNGKLLNKEAKGPSHAFRKQSQKLASFSIEHNVLALSASQGLKEGLNI